MHPESPGQCLGVGAAGFLAALRLLGGIDPQDRRQLDQMRLPLKRWLLRVLCRLDYVVEGREHLPARNGIVLLKHSSAWETLAQLRIFPRQTWVLKRELMWIPVFGWCSGY